MKVTTRSAPTFFGLVPEGAIRRRPSDVVAVGLATAALLFTAWVARHPGDFGRWTFEIATDLPDGLNNAFRLVYFVGCVAIIAAITVACLMRRRVRLAVSMAAAGAVSWVLAFGLVAVINASDARDNAGLDAFGNPPGFPAVRFAAAVSVLFVAAPYLTRPARRLVYLVLLVIGASAVLAVESLFSDIIGSLVLGWGVAALVHLIVGSPAGTPSTSEVEDALRDLDFEVTDLRLVTGPWHWTQYVARLPDGSRAQIEVIGRDARDARVFIQFWRNVWYKGTGAALVWTRRHQVEHWAYLLLTAHKAGVHVGDVVAAGVAGRREDALLVVRRAAGASLAETPPDEVTDEVLDSAWEQVTQLAAAHVAKGGVRGSEVLLTGPGRVSLDNFSDASYPAPPERSSVDAVDLLVVTANVVGVDRAVAAARRALEVDGLTDLLPLVQPAALSSGARREVDAKKQSMKELRTKASEAAGVEEPKLAELRRVSVGDLLMTVGTLVGVYLLIGQFTGLAGLGDVFRSADWTWLVVVILLSQLPQIFGAIAMIGSVMAPLPFGPVVGVQYANNFTGLVGGSVANVALVVRFLQKQGQGAAVAVSSGVLNSFASFATEFVLLPVTLVISGSSLDLSGDGGGSGIEKLVILAIFVVGGAIGVLLVVPALRRRLWALVQPQWSAAKSNLVDVLRHPRKAAQLFGGKLAVEIIFGMVLYASVETFGGHLSLVQLIFINCVASFVGGAAPVPGGMGVVEAGLIAGMTAAGLDEQVAVAATFTHRLFTCYLPPIWGWFALAWLRRREYV